ncbi:ionotropic receptor 21a isoform X2 [Procambarus clarkii]|uniref:ionotropic receptor 21a isoform X2 n=2 Tax=Procambarus clarkii TaxID=6728 RepID=UPI0037441F12
MTGPGHTSGRTVTDSRTGSSLADSIRTPPPSSSTDTHSPSPLSSKRMRMMTGVMVAVCGCLPFLLLLTPATSLDESPAVDLVDVASSVVNAVLRASSSSECSVILLLDPHSTPSTLSKVVREVEAPAGVAVFQLEDEDTNNTHLVQMVENMRRVRQVTWCLTVVVASNQPAFIAEFAELSVAGRLLVWRTRLVVVTRLARSQLHGLITNHWTFTMMNSMILNLERLHPPRFGVFTHLPYHQNKTVVVRLATWTQAAQLTYTTHLQFFPDKYSNFYGGRVTVTALPFPPYWIEEDGNKSSSTQYYGTDYLMLETIAKTLNFTIVIINTTDWDEVTKKVEERESFMATIIYAVLPSRLLHYDFSYPYEYASPTFCMPKPVLKPRFLSLYYPLANEVWAYTLVVLMLVPTAVILMSHVTVDTLHGGIDSQQVIQDVVGTLLGQSMAERLTRRGWARAVFGGWLVFALIIGTAYRGNLTASLTIPKYPPRPETLEELIKVTKMVTMPPYGIQFRDFYSKSDSTVFKTLAKQMEFVPTAYDGLMHATSKRAHIEARRYLQLVIAQKFTLADGSSNLYLGRENVIPGLSAWPLPHDAPYKSHLDRCIMAITEAGLYEKWSKDIMLWARKKNSVEQQENKGQSEAAVPSNTFSQALTLSHLQGPLFLLLLGLGLAVLAFVVEFSIACCSWLKDKKN